jgi:uncharacterized membrane protein
MHKSRLEAFSDGVIAIIITIMVLEMKVPHGTHVADIRPLWPVFLSYVLSFVNVGIYWNNHHHLFQATKEVTGGVLWANLHLLFWLSLFPFVTGWMGENHFAPVPTALYGAVLLLAGIAYWILVRAILNTEGPQSTLAAAVGGDFKGNLSLLLYAIAIPSAFIHQWIAGALYVFVALMWLIPDPRIERRMGGNMGSMMFLLLAVSLFALPVTAVAQRTPVLPRDEAARDAEFFVFRARLQRAVAEHDTAEIMRVVAPDILNSFGGDGGRDEFREHWGLAQPDQSRLWGVLGFVLALGGGFLDDTTFYAPYTMKDTPGDGFETLAVLGQNVMVRAEPAAGSTAIDTISFEAVTKWREKASTDQWEPVRTNKGRMGWVAQRYLRSPIDHRAGFVRRHGRWLLRGLVAGD